MNYIGITERGDAGLDFSWVDKLNSCEASILITKCISDRFIKEAVKAHNENHKLIVHVTVTGYGMSILEPRMRGAEWVRKQIIKLIGRGFPVEQIVLRVDPIIPTEKGLERVDFVLNFFKDLGIRRVRYSFLDMYPHVKARFLSNNLTLPYGNSFEASEEMMSNAVEVLKQYEDVFEFESCAEYTPHKKGCISLTDYEVLGIEKPSNLSTSNQRKACSCLGVKKELLSNKKRCSLGCLYCYWKD